MDRAYTNLGGTFLIREVNETRNDHDLWMALCSQEEYMIKIELISNIEVNT